MVLFAVTLPIMVEPLFGHSVFVMDTIQGRLVRLGFREDIFWKATVVALLPIVIAERTSCLPNFAESPFLNCHGWYEAWGERL